MGHSTRVWAEDQDAPLVVFFSFASAVKRCYNRVGTAEGNRERGAAMSEVKPIVSGAGGTSRKRWEYQVYTIGAGPALKSARKLSRMPEKAGAVEENMNKLGKDGWELVPPVLLLGGDLLLFFRR
jgi:hypothetical protein